MFLNKIELDCTILLCMQRLKFRFCSKLKVMKKLFALTLTNLFVWSSIGQDIIPIDTSHWEITARSYVLEHYKGKDAIYINNGFAMLKDEKFMNGTIEFDIYLTERQSFPGVRFRATDAANMESFFLRPHLSGKPDANQAAPVIKGLTAWQLYFGPAYSFTYKYNFEGWTHVKLVIKDNRGQVFMDYSETPHLSWNLKLTPKEGDFGFGGGFAPMHYANVKVIKDKGDLVDFKVVETDPIEGVIKKWTLSDKFDEELLADPSGLKKIINARTWDHQVEIEENSAANISRVHSRYGSDGNTVFARLIIDSDQEQIKLFEFGYSDRVVAILNGKAIYWGNNRWRTRDYRYLGTIGLFDAVYLNLKKGKNTLLFAVSEDFGGWGITGKLRDEHNISIQP